MKNENLNTEETANSDLGTVRRSAFDEVRKWDNEQLRTLLKTIKSILIWIVSWIISALILCPCLFLSLLSGFKIDYHHKFHLWWYDEVLDKGVL